MIAQTTYLCIGFGIAVIVVVAISYYDDGNSSNTTYMIGPPVVTLLVTVAWPLIVPLVLVSAIAWYVSTRWNEGAEGW